MMGFENWWKAHGIESASYAEKNAARKGWEAAQKDAEKFASDTGALLAERDKQLAECQAALALKDNALEFLNKRIVTMDLGGVVERAIATKPDNKALREWGARLLEESDQAFDAIDGGGINNLDLAAALRSGEWTPEVMK